VSGLRRTLDDDDDDENSKEPRICIINGCDAIGSFDAQRCSKHHFFIKEMKSLCSIEDPKPPEYQSYSIADKKEIAMKKLRAKLKDGTTGVYVGITSNLTDRLHAHKEKNFTGKKVLLESINMKEASQLEFEILVQLETEISKQRIYNQCAGGSYRPEQGLYTACVYALYFKDFIRPQKNTANYKDRKYLDASVKNEYRRLDYLDCQVPKIRTKLSGSSVLKLLGFERKGNKERKDVVVCPICGKNIGATNIWQHNKNHQDKTFACPEADCDKVYKSENALHLHHNKIHFKPLKTQLSIAKEMDKGINSRACPCCTVVCKAPGDLTAHLQSHKDKDFKGKLVCDGCKKIFVSHVSLHFHKATCNGL